MSSQVKMKFSRSTHNAKSTNSNDRKQNFSGVKKKESHESLIKIAYTMADFVKFQARQTEQVQEALLININRLVSSFQQKNRFQDNPIIPLSCQMISSVFTGIFYIGLWFFMVFLIVYKLANEVLSLMSLKLIRARNPSQHQQLHTSEIMPHKGALLKERTKILTGMMRSVTDMKRSLSGISRSVTAKIRSFTGKKRSPTKKNRNLTTKHRSLSAPRMKGRCGVNVSNVVAVVEPSTRSRSLHQQRSQRSAMSAAMAAATTKRSYNRRPVKSLQRLTRAQRRKARTRKHSLPHRWSRKVDQTDLYNGPPTIVICDSEPCMEEVASAVGHSASALPQQQLSSVGRIWPPMSNLSKQSLMSLLQMSSSDSCDPGRATETTYSVEIRARTPMDYIFPEDGFGLEPGQGEEVYDPTIWESCSDQQKPRIASATFLFASSLPTNHHRDCDVPFMIPECQYTNMAHCHDPNTAQ